MENCKRDHTEAHQISHFTTEAAFIHGLGMYLDSNLNIQKIAMLKVRDLLFLNSRQVTTLTSFYNHEKRMQSTDQSIAET